LGGGWISDIHYILEGRRCGKMWDNLLGRQMKKGNFRKGVLRRETPEDSLGSLWSEFIKHMHI
jgi:hypothetical protein